jgi:hypothetical protein
MGVIVCALCPAMADDSVKAQPLPSFAELQAAGAVIGEIRVEPENIQRRTTSCFARRT